LGLIAQNGLHYGNTLPNMRPVQSGKIDSNNGGRQ
jgi:hypothetical protein